MKRSLLATIAVVVLLGSAAAAWAATSSNPTLGSQLGRVVVLGGTSTPVRAPVCPTGVAPANCTIVMTRSTALETITNKGGYPTSVKQSGEIVAFSVGVAQLSSNATTSKSFITTLDTKYGAPPEAELTVLKPAPKGAWTVVAESPLENLQPYLGYVVQFPLKTAIPVTKGEALALTVPTWAPILSYNLSPTYYAYRQSRTFNCTKPGAQQNAQMTVGTTTKYGCNYPGTRAEYAGIERTSPVAPKATTTPTKK
jgi:hypothetical protein